MVASSTAVAACINSGKEKENIAKTFKFLAINETVFQFMKHCLKFLVFFWKSKYCIVNNATYLLYAILAF